MKSSMLPFKNISSSIYSTKLPILIFLILLNFLFSISIVNADISKITPPSSLQLIDPVIGSLKSRAVTIVITHGKKSPHKHGKHGKVNGEGNGEGDGKGNGKGDGKGKGEGNGKGKGEGNGKGNGEGDGKGKGEGNGKGNGEGDGKGKGEGNGKGNGEGKGKGNGEENGKGNGEGNGKGNGEKNGKGNGEGDGKGNGKGDGKGNGEGNGKGNGKGNGEGNGKGKNPNNGDNPKESSPKDSPPDNPNDSNNPSPSNPKTPKDAKNPNDSNNPKGPDNPNDSPPTKTPNSPNNPNNPKVPPPMKSPTTTVTTPSSTTPSATTPSETVPSMMTEESKFLTKYYESIDPVLHVYGAKSYPDGPVILRLSGNEPCKPSTLYLKLVYDVNTMNWINLTFSIPDFNFCQYGVEKKDLIRIFPLSKELNNGFFLVSYLQNSENGLYKETGLIVDWSGTVHSQLELSSIADTSKLGKAVVNNDLQREFMWFNRVDNGTIQWRKYSSPDNVGNIYYAQGEPMTAKIFEGHKFEPFPTLGGGYGYVTMGKNPNATGPKTPPPELLVHPSWVVNVIFIRPNAGEITPPSLIYSSTLSAIDMNVEFCDNAYDSPGLACIISIQINSDLTYYVKIGFLSNGSTRGPVQININSINTSVDHIYPLHHGGYVATVKLKNVQREQLTGYIYDSQGIYVREWDFPRITGNLTISHGVYPNNTAWIFADGGYNEINRSSSKTLELVNNSGWTMWTTDIPKLITLDNGYNNLNVNATWPQIGRDIEIGKTEINITYYNQVTLSVGNISIYQHDSDRLILRQSYSAGSGIPPFVNISLDKKTLTFSVLSSTFNMYNSTYTVVVDDNAVKSLSSDEPLLGITPDTWKFTTPNSQKQSRTTEHALVRLTINSSDYFHKLNSSAQLEFVKSLSKELSQCVPIPIERLYTDSHYQWDPEVESRRILLKFKISPGNNETDMNTDTVIITLNTMIKNREISPISHLPHASLLDSSYGFVHKKSVWDKYEFKLIAVGATLLLLGVLAMLSHKKTDDGNSFVAFRILLIALDFVLDFVFVVTHSKDIYYLYYPSLLTFIIPLGFNTLITFFIVIRELSNNKEFYKWFRTYHNVAAIFSFCSIVDLDSLTMMNSKLASLAAFDAPISSTTENWIFRTSIWNFIIEDTPQLIIQIIYIIGSVNYDIIPFLNLISSSLLWINIVYGFSYRIFIYSKGRRRERRLEKFKLEYTNLNNGGNGDNDGKDDFDDPEIRSVEYVLTTPMEVVSPATIRPPSWWLDINTGHQQHGSGYMAPNNGANDDGGKNDERQDANRGDYEVLERRSSLPLHNYFLGRFDNGNDIGGTGPSTMYNRTRSGSGGISYGMIGSEHGNENTNANTSSSGSASNVDYKRIYGVDRTSQDLENGRIWRI